MDNEGGDLGLGGDPNAGLGGVGLDGGDLGAGQDENLDQYFDDGGETFLPADHVSIFLTDSLHMKIQIVTAKLVSYSYSRLWPVCKTL